MLCAPRAVTVPDADLTAEYWGHSNVSDRQVGSAWEHRRTDGSRTADVVGTVMQSQPPTRLVSTWAEPGDDGAGTPSLVTFDIEAFGEIVRLTITHETSPTTPNATWPPPDGRR